MIVKPRNMPIYIKKLEALLRRLPQDHPKREFISNNLLKRATGYKGEKELDYPLSFLPEDEYMIFHDLRLYDGSHYFQVDSLIVSQHFVLILEAKNIQGTLQFDPDFNQLIRIYGGKEEAFSDPLLQVERQTSQLKKWLKMHKLSQLPIESLVVISTPRTIIQTFSNNPQIRNKVIHCAKLPFKIKSIKESFPNKILNTKKFLQLKIELKENHIPLEIDIFKHMDISESEVQNGIQCINCFAFSMERREANWICSICQHKSKTAHINSLNDYALLFGKEITNQKLREFLNVHSSSVAKKILSSMNLNSTGKNKGKIYYLEINDN
ncbi:NERD domain-containing protein [Bacillus sp. RG28]|uniref:NERD domain-containing protein n=1 Tax=Gottfriedia endophytica TaxID=2820819 RepID=A0A940NUI8_9BACI|nr:nuclease-related domain-containing protein [Gottfriedia endophytica]MBP0725098.1 NERD domain-containing protein [Gottfriedia endophytica]